MRMMQISTNPPPPLHLALVNGEYVFQFTLGLINSVTSVSVNTVHKQYTYYMSFNFKCYL
jgi:hypothetical protein